MSKGLRMPVGVNRTGGTATVKGDDQAWKVIEMALSDNDSDNAFQQDIGLGSSAIFKVRSPSFRALVTNRIKEMFAEFERLRLYKLVRASIKWEAGGPGEQVLHFTFINLESDEPKEFSRTFKAGS